ncbi:MAG: EAL domain-containing protein [Azospirillum sp.]|nr:EAL domain-containing protein [Azospirillum sp.]
MHQPVSTPQSLLIERYELAEKAGREGLWDWDLRTDTLYMSPRFRELVGLSPSATGHQPPDDWLDRVHPEDLEWLYACFEGQMGGMTLPFHIEHRVRRGEAEWRWLICRGVAVNGSDGEPERMVGSISDITERKLAEQSLRQSEERYALAAAASNDGLYDWDLRSNTIYYAPRWKSLLGFAEEEIGSSPEDWLRRVHRDDLIWLQATLDAQTDAQTGAGGKPFQIEYRMADARGAWRWMLCRGLAVLDAFGCPVRIVGSQADITDRKLAEQSLRQSEERYALAAHGANDGLWDWQIASGEAYFSPRWREMLGCRPDADGEASGGNPLDFWFRRVVPDDLPALKAAIDLHLAGQGEHLEQECRMIHADGSELWVVIRGLAVRDESGRPFRFAGSMTNITTRKRAELQLQHDALYDGLTGLANRTLLLDRVGQALDRRHRSGGKEFALLLIDLDRFKQINESLGTGSGDLVLTSTAVRLARFRRIGDTLGRLSADEFCLLLDEAGDPTTALATAQAMLQVLAKPFQIVDREVVLTASIGIASSATGYDNPADMLRDAGLAMVRAKAEGRNRAEVSDARLREHVMARIRIETALRRAVEREQLRLYYQPIVFLDNRGIAGFEALMRWEHPDHGLVSPDEFIPIAEECGLIGSLGNWALTAAARQLARWHRQFPEHRHLFVGVNVSTQQFRDDDLLDRVRRCLSDSGVSPTTLRLELTESTFMQDPERAEEVMRAIRALGVRLAIDDFGTGYSSLSYLQRFPADTLKIDRGFVQALANRKEDAAIVRVITTLAAVLGLEVCAEGIETENEAAFLQTLGCRYGQGYLFGKPISPEQVPALLSRTSADQRRS